LSVFDPASQRVSCGRSKPIDDRDDPYPLGAREMCHWNASP
jgi:hypothetical protein